MISRVTSAIAGILLVVYLGYYAVMLNQLPLWIVIIGVLVMALTDFALTAREDAHKARDRENDTG